MLREEVSNFLQDKNFVMLLITMLYVVGILSFFYDKGIYCAAVITLIAVLGIIKKVFNLKYIILAVLMFYFGYTNALIQIKPTDDILPLAPAKTSVVAQVISIQDIKGNGKSNFFAKVSRIGNKEVKGKILINTPIPNNYKIGNTYKFEGRLSIPHRATNPSQFDYAKYLMNFRVYTVLYVQDEGKFVPLNLSFKWKSMQKLDDIRHKIMAQHSKYIMSPNSEILGGVVFGDDAVAPPDDIKFSFVHSGLLHILAASGMNVAFIFGFWFFLMFTVLKLPFKPCVISGMLLVILYTLMTGMGASVVRAALMLLFILAGKLVDRDARSISLLSFVALLMLIYNPAYINNVSFQLSFLATLGLLTTGNIIFEKVKSDSKIIDFAQGSVIIPFVAQIWVAPIQMFYFNTFSPYSIFANIVSVPFITVISCGGFFSSIIAIFSPFTNFIVKYTDIIVDFMITCLVNGSNFFAGLSHSLIDTTHPSIFQLSLYYIIIVCITSLIKFGISSKLGNNLIKIISVTFTMFLISLVNLNFSTDKLEIISFDVQNADCFLLKSPKNKYFIIDTGKAGYNKGSSQAKVILLKYLKDRGIKDIESVIVTHFDSDHSGGAVDLIKNLNIKTLYLSNLSDESTTSKNIYKAIKEYKVNSTVALNNTLIYNEPEFFIRNFRADIEGKDKDNENSIVTLVTYKDFDMLFMGDGTVETFEKIKSQLPHNVEVLKVGHHGANGVVSSSMIDSLNNKVSIISTGVNKYGHPTMGTLDILRKTDIYRTDNYNAIKITSKGLKYTVAGFNPTTKKFVNIKDY